MSARLPPPFLAPRLYRPQCHSHNHTAAYGKGRKTRSFHTSPASRADSTNHYETLGVSPSASQADIKKQFYHLSRTHHPDHNRQDPEGASRKFVAISEAYAIVGDPKRRDKYDRENAPASTFAGSYSGSSGSAYQPGGRKASGLSKRRGQFRGPPPSFYRSGGFGKQSARRSANASDAQGQGEKTAGSSWQQQRERYANAGGNVGGSYTGEQDGWPFTTDPNDVRHFNRGQHFRTQSSVEEQLRQGRRKRRRAWEEQEAELNVNDGVTGAMTRFIIVGGMLMLGVATPLVFLSR